MTLGDLLGEARERQGLTKVAAAEQLGVTEMTYRQWEEDRWLPDCRDRERTESIAAWVGVEPAIVLGLVGILVEAEVVKIVGKRTVGRLF